MANPLVEAALRDIGPGPRMGLVAIAERDWILLGPDTREKLVLKRRLLAERHDEVFAALPCTEEAGGEVVDMLFDVLPRHFPTQYPRMGAMFAIAATAELVSARSPALHPLDIAGRIVPEDLCLMRADASGTYRLVAASLCFPSHWSLAEKLGQPVAEIHGPVPAYVQRLAGPVDRFFASLADERIVERYNWTIHTSPELFQPHRTRDHDVAPERFDADLFLRIERQTLRRLPRARDILFTIRTFVTALGTLAPDQARRLGTAIAALSEDARRYKRIARLAAPLGDWLARR
jgi:hypothetical protein